MRIEELAKYQRNRNRERFDDLPLAQRREAEAHLWRLCKRWRNNFPPWRIAILTGRARDLVLRPRTSDWGRRMRSKKGGLAVQKLYRARGVNPTAQARKVREVIRDARQKPRYAFLPL